MLSECARGVFLVAEVKPSRWVYIMNLIGILAIQMKIRMASTFRIQ